MEVSGHLNKSAALYPVSTGNEAGWAPEPV